MRKVTLSRSELFQAAMCGVQRHIDAIFKGLEDRHGADNGNGWSLHVEGAAGEMAAAKGCRRYYDFSVGTFKNGGDVGKAQVRTRSSDDYDLLVRRDDDDDSYFVLVTGRAPSFKLWGYIKGKDAKRNKWLKVHAGREPAYFIPKEALTPL